MRIRRRVVDSEIPTASMADVAFLLLVFFMLATTFASTAGLDLRLPDEEESEEVEPVDSIFIEVRADGGLAVDGRALALRELVGHLAPILAAAPDKPVIVHTAPAAPYGAMVDVLRAADLLGRHVARRAEHRERHRHLVRLTVTVGERLVVDLRDAEVDHLHQDAVVRPLYEEHVRRLEVAVDDAVDVRRGERAAYLQHTIDRALDRERAVLLQHPGDIG